MSNNVIILLKFIIESFSFPVVLAYSTAMYLKHRPKGPTLKSTMPFFLACAIGIPGVIITALLRYNLPNTGDIVWVPELLGILIATLLIFRLLQKMVTRKRNWNIAIACMTFVLLALKFYLLSTYSII